MRKLNIGKIKIVFFLLLMLLWAFHMPVRALEKEDQKKKILEIKLNEDFVFGEGVSDDKDIAYGLAMDELLIFANELKGRNSQEKLTASDLITKAETLFYENGSRVEVIVYIPIDIVLATGHKKPDTKGGVVLKQPEISEPEEREVPIITEPKIEEPKIEEPKLQEPKLEEPKNEGPKNEEPKLQEPKIEETNLEEPKIEEPKIEEPKIEESIPHKKTSSEVECFLITQDNFSEIKAFLSDMKRKGEIIETGATDAAKGLPTDASLIIMDEMGGILAILSPETVHGRMNYKTQKPDSENNYNSKFILWYKK